LLLAHSCQPVEYLCFAGSPVIKDIDVVQVAEGEVRSRRAIDEERLVGNRDGLLAFGLSGLVVLDQGEGSLTRTLER
jgi:hypothetical protein